MKAWKVYDINCVEGFETVVFAETRNKARNLALRTEACEYSSYIDIHANRMPELDCEYRGRWEMDWYDKDDRLALVKLGWGCDWDSFSEDECEKCCAKEYCDQYEYFIEVINEEREELK